MPRKLARRLTGTAAAAAIGLWSGQAAQAMPAVVHVPCSATSLASAIGGAFSGEMLTLTADCTYTLTTGLPTVGQDLSILGNHATVKRSTRPSTPAFTILSVDAGILTVSNLNFSDGDGAISATQDGSLTVRGGTFTGNSAANGGAIYAFGGAGNLSVTDARFIKNSATDDGGAIYSSLAAGSTDVTGDTFIMNAAGAIGGGLYNFYDTDVSNSTFRMNRATDGGGIFNNALFTDNLTNVTMSGNTATENGGGVATYQTNLSLSNDHIIDNHAGNDGGGIYQEGSAGFVGLALTGTTLKGNVAQSGGGIYNTDDAANVTGSTVSDNQATADGGGVYNEGSYPAYGNVNLETSVVTVNKAGANGGGIYNDGSLGAVAATGSQVTRNSAVAGGGIYDDLGSSTKLTSSPVQHNEPDNCEPPDSITGCTG
jgi:predicted outer membrane repeat protein